jgi:prepilin-type N-terminal cleavage/methylation domain-containing protein
VIMKKKRYALRQDDISDKGFTIVELLIATLIFSVVLVVLTTSFISISNNFYKGVTAANVQNTARNVANDIVQAIQNNSGPITSGVPNNGSLDYCIGGVRYSYLLGYELKKGLSMANDITNQSPYGLVTDAASTYCDNNSPALDLKAASVPPVRELLTENTRLLSFTINPIGSCDGANSNLCLYSVNVVVIYGDNDLLTAAPYDANTICQSGSGSQSCAWTQLSTFAYKRVQL